MFGIVVRVAAEQRWRLCAEADARGQEPARQGQSKVTLHRAEHARNGPRSPEPRSARDTGRSFTVSAQRRIKGAHAACPPGLASVADVVRVPPASFLPCRSRTLVRPLA